MDVFYSDEEWNVRLTILVDLLKSLLPEEKVEEAITCLYQTLEFAENKQKMKLYDELLECHHTHISDITLKKVTLLGKSQNIGVVER